LIDLCETSGVTVEGYGSLASLFRNPGGPVDSVASDIARELGASEGQVLLKWAHQVTHGGPIVTTSSKPERLEEHMKAFTELGNLSGAQIKAIEEAGNKSPKPFRVSTIMRFWNNRHTDGAVCLLSSL
jgi:diketogulonate reductase-like aldo/keto reductase